LVRLPPPAHRDAGSALGSNEHHPMELATQRLATVALLVIGLSHAVQCRAWARFLMMLGEKGEAGVLANALLHFWPGLLIASFHDVWTGIPLILTVYGWLLVLKGTLY
jgi:hypothetical protein